MIITRDGVSENEAERLVMSYRAGVHWPQRTGYFAHRGAEEPDVQVDCLGHGVYHVQRCEHDPGTVLGVAEEIDSRGYRWEFPYGVEVGEKVLLRLGDLTWETVILSEDWGGLEVRLDIEARPSLWKQRPRVPYDGAKDGVV